MHKRQRDGVLNCNLALAPFLFAEYYFQQSMKRRRSDSGSSESGSEDTERRRRLLALLDAQCSALTGVVEASVNVANSEEQEQRRDSDSDSDSEDEQDTEEWTGIDAGGSPSKEAVAVTVIYDGQSRASYRTLQDTAKELGQRDSFMVG